MTRKAKEDKQVEVSKKDGKASVVKNKGISKQKANIIKAAPVGKENKPKASKLKKSAAPSVARKTPIKSAAKATPSKRALAAAASDAIYEPSKKDLSAPGRYKASKVATRQLKAPTDASTEAKTSKESPSEKLKADERLLFGSVADHKPPSLKPLSSIES